MFYFHIEDLPSFVLSTQQQEQISSWLQKIIEGNGKEVGDINYIFCNDAHLHQINLQYLQHDTYTDIITFDNSDDQSIIESDIFISIERIHENAKKFNTLFENELHRVMVHGILHLLGHHDKTPEQQAQMRQLENNCLEQLEK